MKKIYRIPIDFIEEFSTGCSTKVLLNSNFTVDVFKKTFKSLSHMDLDVLYPIANTDSLKISDLTIESIGVSECRKLLPRGIIPDNQFLILSINRYERKKKLELAVFSLKYLLQNWEILVNSSHVGLKPSQVHMVIAGGYDFRVQENVSYHNELTQLCEQLSIKEHVTFLRSCPAETKSLLIASSDVVLYTPENEHFGIVPIEAMYLSRPVIGLNCGGPKETILNGQTGFLCEASSVPTTSQAIAEHISKFINDPDLSKRMGEAGHRRVVEQFSSASFQKQLERIISDMLCS